MGELLQPSVRFFKLLSDDPFRVYLTAYLAVAVTQWLTMKVIKFLRYIVDVGADSIIGR
jgi:hypothetical protein